MSTLSLRFRLGGRLNWIAVAGIDQGVVGILARFDDDAREVLELVLDIGAFQDGAHVGPLRYLGRQLCLERRWFELPQWQTSIRSEQWEGLDI